MKVYYAPRNTNNFVFLTNNYINNDKNKKDSLSPSPTHSHSPIMKKQSPSKKHTYIINNIQDKFKTSLREKQKN